MMAADVSSVARLLRGEAGKRGGAAAEVVTMDLLGGCGGDAGGGGGSRGGGGGGEDEVVDLEVKVPAGWERRLDLMSGKTFLTPRLQGVQVGHQDLNLPPPASAAAAAAAATSTSAAVCTLDMVRSALERATAGRAAAAAAAGASPATSSSSSASTSSSSSSVGKRHRSPPAGTATPASPSMRAAACPSCLTYVLIAEADPRCPRCAGNVPPLAGKPRDAAAAGDGSGKKPKIDLNAAADDTE
ncbi:putative lysozyme-like protein [Oryza brachyantha]|uniref:putative lysozyme-like protein n=1 Tax=Oryza brachyantha TaxID=4533 RepID=UPI001ADA8E28|nr:putative lysozyme-like protein [Oryza brachyantha]